MRPPCRRWAVFLFGAAMLHGAAAQSPAWEVWQAPARLAEIDAADSVLERSSHCLDGCRYDRSNAGAESANAYPERWLYRDGDEAVVFDEPGPGAVTRIWMTTGFGTSTCIDPAMRVRFYLDGAAAPTLDLPLAALFDGSTAPFTPPLVADRSQSSGGYVSQVPIAYAHGVRIALLGAENGGSNPCQPAGSDPAQRLLWFQIQYHRAPPGAALTSFVAGHDEPGWRAFLAHAGDDPWAGMLAPDTTDATLAAGASVSLATRAGVGWLRGIRLHLPRAAYADVYLRLTFDGEVAVDLPLADFFATDVQASVPARSVLLGEDAGGWLYAWWPMPFLQSAQVELHASADLPAPVALAGAVTFDTAPVTPASGRFAATLADTCADAGSVTLYTAGGAGKIVGMAARYHAAGAATLGYLEGDERASIDDAITPAWYGTGIEDFYNGGFYFDQGAVANALSGVTEVDADGSGRTAAYRLMLTDPLTWTHALHLTQEAGFSPAQPSPLCARSVTYAYRRAQPLSVEYASFAVGDPVAAAAHRYVPPDTAQCVPLSASFEDEPPTARSATVCRYASGSSHFRFAVGSAAPPLRLRRTFDAGAGLPGAMAGSPAADVWINGVLAGRFPVAMANPVRRWQEQEIVLDVPPGTSVFDVQIVPRFSAFAADFSEAQWQLRGGWKDAIFADGFDSAPMP